MAEKGYNQMNFKEEIANLHTQIRYLEGTRLNRIEMQKREAARKKRGGERAGVLSEAEQDRMTAIMQKQAELEALVGSSIERIAHYLANVAATPLLKDFVLHPEKATTNPELEYVIKRVARRAIALNRLAEPLGPHILFLPADVVSRIKQLARKCKTDPAELVENLLNNAHE